MNIYKHVPYAVKVAMQVLLSIPLMVLLASMIVVLFVGWGGSTALAFIKTWDDLVLSVGEDDND